MGTSRKFLGFFSNDVQKGFCSFFYIARKDGHLNWSLINWKINWVYVDMGEKCGLAIKRLIINWKLCRGIPGMNSDDQNNKTDPDSELVRGFPWCWVPSVESYMQNGKIEGLE